MKQGPAIALAAVLAAFATPLLAEPIKVDGGMIDGRALASGVDGWFGIPFAAPPLRELRWRAPQPVKPWQGVLQADRFAPMCLQAMRTRLAQNCPSSCGFMEAGSLSARPAWPTIRARVSRATALSG